MTKGYDVKVDGLGTARYLEFAEILAKAVRGILNRHNANPEIWVENVETDDVYPVVGITTDTYGNIIVQIKNARVYPDVTVSKS